MVGDHLRRDRTLASSMFGQNETKKLVYIHPGKQKLLRFVHTYYVQHCNKAQKIALAPLNGLVYVLCLSAYGFKQY